MLDKDHATILKGPSFFDDRLDISNNRYRSTRSKTMTVPIILTLTAWICTLF